MTRRDRSVLRDLAMRVAEIAELPVMAQRRADWIRHNKLEPVRPMILVFPEGSWRELLPDSAIVCEDDSARDVERDLRRRLFYHEGMFDDTVVERVWTVNKAVRVGSWGLEPRRIESTTERGAWAFDPVLLDPTDLEKLTAPEVTHDEDATRDRFEQACDLFGDILDVRLKGVNRVSFHLMSQYCHLRGLEQALYDLADNPSLIHDVMALLEEGHRGIVSQYEAQNLLDLNNDGTYHSSGGVGYTDELPAPGFDPERVRPRDLWASAEAQELDPVSPTTHEEFVLQYERRLLEPFGLNGYGCCDDLITKMDYVSQIRNIRRISVCSWSDVSEAARRLNGDYIFSWKPNPAVLVGTFDAELVRGQIQHTLDVSQDCVLEMILKDTHTCEHQPERFTEWTRIARELVEDQ